MTGPPFIDVVFQSADFLVVNKPAGLVCHPTKGDDLSSLASRVRLFFNRAALADPVISESPPHNARLDPSPVPQSSEPAVLPASPSPFGAEDSAIGHRPPAVPPAVHFVNRLDRETSGIILLALTREAAGELGKIWEARRARKSYLALVHGRFPFEPQTIEAPLGRDLSSLVAVKDCVRADGAPARTDARLLRWFERDGRPFSLVELEPRTGRKHQIRIHLAHLGHPLVGEKLYAGVEDDYLALVQDRLTEEVRRRLILPCQALHAARLRFSWRGRDWDFHAPPEPWFQAFVPESAAVTDAEWRAQAGPASDSVFGVVEGRPLEPSPARPEGSDR